MMNAQLQHHVLKFRNHFFRGCDIYPDMNSLVRLRATIGFKTFEKDILQVVDANADVSYSFFYIAPIGHDIPFHVDTYCHIGLASLVYQE